MDSIYPTLREAEVLVLATPVYVPLPGIMQNFLNRLCPLMEPRLSMRGGRTRARLRGGVKLRKIVGIVTSGWWERANCDTVVRIFQELAEDIRVPLATVITRPHAGLMWDNGSLTEAGAKVVGAARQAGEELATRGTVGRGTIRAICRPLVSRRAYLEMASGWIDRTA
jgi:multimeric flavodoxin WrbA